ncbi:protein artemis-like isoform X2 [Zootermopsis nevadensis]|nr:protein artemis-like isoform X2 [Zootermopsis nevadensis]
MRGLRSNFFLKRLDHEAHVYLYCSEITAHILSSENTFSEVLHKIKVLPLGVSSIVKILDHNGSAEDVTVSLIPTGHCPGAVMFLFEGEMGRILYTGDFRLCEGDVSRFRQFHYLDGTVKVIDKLYVDTTFLSRRYQRFPSRTASMSILCNLITSWLHEGHDNDIYIQTAAKYGSEAVFIAVAKQLGMKIHVNDTTYNVYKNIAEIKEAVTDDPYCTRIHACQQYKWPFRSRDKTTILPCRNKSSKLRIIRPCAMTFTSKVYDGSLESAVLQSDDQELFRVCYSCHCSYGELEHFIKYLKPRQIQACVIPQNMEEAGILDLLKKVSRWGNGSSDMPLITVSKKCTKNGISSDMATFSTTALMKQENAASSGNFVVVEEASRGNMPIEWSNDDAEIYRLIAEDLKPKIGDPDAIIKQNIRLEFLEIAACLNKSVV